MKNLIIIKNNDWKEVEINGEIKNIPDDWEISSFKKFGGFKTGKDYKEILGNNFNVFGSSSIPMKFKTNKPLYDKPSFLLGRKGTIDKPFKINIPFWCVDTAMYFNTLKNANTDFVFYQAKAIDWYKYSSGSTVPSLVQSVVNNIEITSPPISQQSAIATILSKQEQIISDMELLITKLESRFIYLSNVLLSGKIRVKELDGKTVLYKNTEWKEVEVNGEIKEIPNGWKVEKISEISEFKNGYAFNKKDYSDNKNYALIEVGNININGYVQIKKENKYINHITTKLKSFILKKDDIVMPMTDMSHERIHVGTPAIIATDDKFLLNQRVGAIKLKDKEIVNYIYFIIKYNQTYFGNNTVGGGPYNMGTNIIKDFEFLSAVEKIEILSITNLLSTQYNIVKLEKQKLEQEKQKCEWLLENLLSGKYLIKE